MASVQRNAGGLGSNKIAANRRNLLPAEAQLCNAVGLTEEEYWFFVALTDAYTSEKKEGYELVPDIRNEPVTLISLVIGIALQAISIFINACRL